MKLILNSVAIALSAAPLAAQDDDPDLVVSGGRVFAPEHGTLAPPGQLWIRAGRVLAHHPLDAAIPDGARTVDATDCVLLPGMFDLHVHVAVAGGDMTSFTLGIAPEENLATQLYCGVTHVLDLHGDQATIFDLRERSRSSEAMARLYTVGGAFTRPDGHATQFGIPANTVDSPEDVAVRFADLLPDRPDAIKAILEHGGWGGMAEMPTLDADLFASIAEHAERAELPLFSHVWTRQEALTAARGGADVLAHGVFLGVVDDEVTAAMRENATAYVPTLSVVLATVRKIKKQQPYAHDLAAEALHPDLHGPLVDEGVGATGAFSPMGRLGTRQEKVYLQNLAAMHEAGVPIGIGTDAGNPFVPHGPGLLFELQLYVDAGMTPAEALRAATLTSARILRVDEDFGTLDPGKVADLVVVSGDPTADIAEVWNVRDVFKAGVRVDRSAVRARNRERARAPAVLRAGTDVPSRINDFEDGKLDCPWGGSWVPTLDAVAGGDSTAVVEVREADGNKVLHIAGELKAGFPWGAWAGASVQWDKDAKKVVDARAYEGIKIRLRGTPGRAINLVVLRAAVKDFNMFTKTIRPREEWSEVEIYFDDLRQIGFGKSVRWSAEDIKGLQIEARNTPLAARYGKFVLEIDWIELF